MVSSLRVRQSFKRMESRFTPRQLASISLAQLVPKTAAASSNLIVSAETDEEARIERISTKKRIMNDLGSNGGKLERLAGLRGHAQGAGTLSLQSADQASVDQGPVETAGLGALLAGIEQALAAQHDFLLFLEWGIERDAGGLLNDQRQGRSIDSIHH